VFLEVSFYEFKGTMVFVNTKREDIINALQHTTHSQKYPHALFPVDTDYADERVHRAGISLPRMKYFSSDPADRSKT
jgi:hypothetical protein